MSLIDGQSVTRTSRNGSSNVDLPAGWATVKLDECCLIEMGQSPPSETYNSVGSGLPFFQGKAEFGELYPTPVKWCSSPSKIAEAGDILISVRAPVGPTNICRERSCIGRGLAAIRPEAEIPTLYILYFLRHIQEKLEEKATGTTFSAISGGVLRNQDITLAPLAEQQRIVTEIETQFTRLDAGVAALKRSQAALKRYKAAVLKAACEGKLVPQDPNDEPADVLLQRILAERRAKWEAEQLAKMRAQGKTPRDDKWKEKYEEPKGPDTEGLPELPEGWCWACPAQLAAPNAYSLAIGPFGSNLKVTDYRSEGVPLVFVRNIRSHRFEGPGLHYVSQEKAKELRPHQVMAGDILIPKFGPK